MEYCLYDHQHSGLISVFEALPYEAGHGDPGREKADGGKRIDEAAVSSRDADLLKKKYELSLENAKAEADDIVTKAKVRASEEYDRILKKADADAAKKADEAKKVIELEREKALNDLQASVTGLAMTAAAKLLSEQSSPENDRKRYQAFLASAGEKHD